MAKLKKGLKSTHISTHCTIPSMQELGSVNSPKGRNIPEAPNSGRLVIALLA